LTTKEALSYYAVLAETVFSEKNRFWKDGTFKASNLEKAIKGVLEGKLGKGHSNEMMYDTRGGTCKTQVELTVLAVTRLISIDSFVRFQRRMLTDIHDCFALGSQTKTQDTIAPSGRQLEQRRLLQEFSNAFPSKTQE
jgi:hypothetical protein